ncbi:MAG TPA: hypothetical protein VH306_14150 [Gaiellaceae bacterium]|jgi:hypothetical protein
MSEQEREMKREPDVEGHKFIKAQDEPTDEEAGLRREGDDPDVEGHMKAKS